MHDACPNVMPAPVLSFPASKIADFSLLELARPGMHRAAIGVFLFDAASRALAFRLRDDWEELDLDEHDLEYIACLADDFTLRIDEMGGEAFLLALEDSLSNFLTVSEREPARGLSLDDLYERHVDGRIRRFETHLPVYSLRAAATKFGDDMEVEAEAGEWRRVAGLRLHEGMFIAQVVGQSMEPLIPDGSFCVFRAPVVGSRQGKHLLIEVFGATDSSARFTVKRYTSQKRESGDGEWEHASIRLEPLNREFPAFQLEEGQFRVVGEFVKAL
jgi:phage repressor protein C with HTH and peptisase S24 domain